MPTQLKFASNVNEQINPNLTARIRWKNIGNAVGKSDAYATSEYTISKILTKKATKKTKAEYKKYYNYPYTLATDRYGFNIPSDAYIKSIKVGVRMKGSGADATFPEVGFYVKDARAKVKDAKEGRTGFHDGVYWVYSNRKLSKSLYTEEYVMSGDTFYKAGYNNSDINQDYFGVDLVFADKIKEETIYLKWVWIEVDYEVPEWEMVTNHNANDNKGNPLSIPSGEPQRVAIALKQKTRANGGTRAMVITIPWGMKVMGVPVHETGVITNVSTDNQGNTNYTWSGLDCNGKSSHKIVFQLVDYTVNEQNILAFVPTIPISKGIYYRTYRASSDGYGEINIDLDGSTPPHKRHDTNFYITAKVESDDNIVNFKISNDKDFKLCSSINTLVESVVGNCSGGVELQSYDFPNTDGVVSANTLCTVTYKVPPHEVLDIQFKLCIRPLVEGDNEIICYDEDIGLPMGARRVYTVAPSYSYHIGLTANDSENPPEQHYVLNSQRIGFVSHRIASTLTTGAFVLPCKVKDGDSVMIQSKPNIRMYKWEQLDYIGCVPLEHLHFDPKSTYKDTLLESNYKNKRYMGKKLAPTEDISLNVRLHPHQVTTIQGLIDMDKPIPINANHRCFESDALNHRGWAEIYSITTTETNPSWYKCDIDVRYLTHNLNTRFKIKKGDRTFNYPIPEVMDNVIDSGDPLNTDESLNYFKFDTDGLYTYTEPSYTIDNYLDDDGNPIIYQKTAEIEQKVLEIEDEGFDVYDLVVGEPIKVRYDFIPSETSRNQFTLDEGQHIRITTQEPVSQVNHISLRWSTSKLAENKENSISRITRLIDKATGNAVFEYEYTDFDFSNYEAVSGLSEDDISGRIACRVIGRRKDREDYIQEINQVIYLRGEVDVGDIDGDEDILEFYGSTVHFKLNNNVLTVEDDGFSGKELVRGGIQLEGSEYYWETYWENRNTDGEDDDILTYFDIVVQNTLLDSNLSAMYSNMYISPFPVTDRKVLFSRDAEEGVLYYLEGKSADDTEVSYLIEPYYQYHNGVDLRNEAGSSIFNLNYGYKTVYLENGLVSLGINRLTGDMYLRKYDTNSKEYVQMFRFHLFKYDDVNINSISDDKISLQASDTIITMYRGHPYVILSHGAEDIGINGNFKRILGQSVNGEVSDYPTYYDLLNTSNKLPSCVGGVKTLDKSCVEISEVEVFDLNDVSVALNPFEDNVYVDELVEFSVTTDVDGDIHYLINGDNVGSAHSSSVFGYTFSEDGAYTVTAVYVGSDTNNYCVSDSMVIHIMQHESEEPVPPEPPVPPVPPEPTGKYRLSISTPSTFRYRDGKNITVQLTKGGVPMDGKLLQLVTFLSNDTCTTANQGKCTFSNSSRRIVPNKYVIGARYFEGGKKIAHTSEKDGTVTVLKGISQFSKAFSPSRDGGKVYEGDTLVLKLKDSFGNNIAGEKVTVHVNNDKVIKKTNENGNIHIKINKKGAYTFKCVFNGNKYYENVELSFNQKVGAKKNG